MLGKPHRDWLHVVHELMEKQQYRWAGSMGNLEHVLGHSSPKISLSEWDGLGQRSHLSSVKMENHLPFLFFFLFRFFFSPPSPSPFFFLFYPRKADLDQMKSPPT